MECPHCGDENRERLARCPSCGREVSGSGQVPARPDVKVSKAAVGASVLTLLAVAASTPAVIAALDPRIIDPGSLLVNHSGALTWILTMAAFVTGLVSWSLISTSGGRRTGRAFACVGVAFPFVLFFGATVWVSVPGLLRMRGFSSRMSCGTNLSGIGKAMLIYANEYDDRLPVAGADGTVWGPRLDDWAAEERSDAFGLAPDDTGGQATVSSSLYLLVRYAEVSPRAFVCRGDRRVRPFDPNDYPAAKGRLTGVWDFGLDPVRHNSYAYHLPYASHALTTTSEPGMAVAADRNPWIDGPFWDTTDFSRFEPAPPLSDGTMQQARYGNSIPHKLDGQNVLFLDSHVEFARQSCCGLEDENIYTRWNEGDKWRGTPPEPYDSTPADERDSLLINDPAAP